MKIQTVLTVGIWLWASGCLLEIGDNAPLYLHASDNGPGSGVELTWNRGGEQAANGITITSFDVSRDSLTIATGLTGTSYLDSAASQGQAHVYVLTAHYQQSSDMSTWTDTATDTGFWLDEQNLLAGSAPGKYSVSLDLSLTNQAWFVILVQSGWTYHVQSTSLSITGLNLFATDAISSPLGGMNATLNGLDASFTANRSGKLLLRVNFAGNALNEPVSLWYE